MKKIASIFAMLLMVLSISLSLNSCGGVTASALADSYNKQCPKDLGNGFSMTSAKAEGSTIVMNISVPEGTDLQAMEAGMDKASAVAQLKAADKDFFEGVATLGCSLKYVYSDGTDSIELLLTPEDFK
jgi:hypothetical protein